MKKRMGPAVRLSDGYRAAMVAEPPPREPTPVEIERDELAAEILADRAVVLIRDLLLDANHRGLDTSDPDLIRRAIAMGREEYEEYESQGIYVATFAALRNSTRARGEHVPLVYYMRMSGLVKIGTSVNVGKRLAVLGAQGVMAVEPGGSQREHERHAQFAHLHDHLEWFDLAPDLAAHIGDLREQFEREMGVTTETWMDGWQSKRKAKSRTSRERVAI